MLFLARFAVDYATRPPFAVLQRCVHEFVARLQDDAKRTLMAGISVFQGRYEAQIPLTMAGMVIASAPMVILYIAFQKYFIRGLMAGAIK